MTSLNTFLIKNAKNRKKKWRTERCPQNSLLSGDRFQKFCPTSDAANMTSSTGKAASTSASRPKTPENVRQALKSARTASAELIQASKSLLQAGEHSSDFTQTPLDAIAKLASLIHSHTVRTALTCGPTASSPMATLGCIKDLHEPILPMISDFQNLSPTAFPEFFIASVRRSIVSLLDTVDAFVGEVVEIACGDTDVESRERLQYSGMMMESCDRLQRICKDGPIAILRGKLRETEEMLNDALEEVAQVIDPTENDEDDGWNDEPTEYTTEEKTFAKRAQTKLKLLSFLYKAISKRRLSTTTSYDSSHRPSLDLVYSTLGTLEVPVDDLVAGITAQEDPMTLELSIVQTVGEARKLAETLRSPLTGIADGRETWFDTWLEKMIV
jgi:hypothetical protein